MFKYTRTMLILGWVIWLCCWVYGLQAAITGHYYQAAIILAASLWLQFTLYKVERGISNE